MLFYQTPHPQAGSLPFLEINITRLPDSTLGHSVYRKPTHTDRYIRARSFHPSSIKSSIHRTLVQRAYNISDNSHLQQELQHVKQVHKSNGYNITRNITKQPQLENKQDTENNAIAVLIRQPHIT